MSKALVSIGIAFVVKFAKSLFLKTAKDLVEKKRSYRSTRVSLEKENTIEVHVEDQWVFGRIEQDFRKCFLVAVKKRDKRTLPPIIQKWIAPGTIIVSDMLESMTQIILKHCSSLYNTVLIPIESFTLDV